MGIKMFLSVIIPVYNAERYIEECVKSILKQTYLSLDVVLVNDGSTDQSGILCDLLAEQNTCVRVLHKEHEGIIKARFAGAKISVGEWITFVDADDWIAENAYQNLVAYKDCDVVMTGICRYFNAEYQIMQMPSLQEGLYRKEEIGDKIIPVMLWEPRKKGWALDPSLCTKIFKRKVLLEELEKAFLVESDYGEDSIVIFPMMLSVDKVRVVKKIYYFHRQRPDGEIPPYIRDEEYIPKLSKIYGYLKMRFMETEYWDVLKNQLDCFYISSIEMKKRCYEYLPLEFAIYFPIDKITPRSKVVLYGAGRLGKGYREQNDLYYFCDIISWVDSKYKLLNIPMIKSPEIIRELVYDYVLIAIDDYYIAKEAVVYLRKIGVKQEKIVWHSVRVNHRKFDEIFSDPIESIGD